MLTQLLLTLILLVEGNQLFINKSEPCQIGDFQPAGRTRAKTGFTIFVFRLLRFLSFSGNHGVGKGALNFNLDKLLDLWLAYN